MTLVSVVIPTFDRSSAVTSAIDSVLGQSHRDLEVIVVDDGSTDDTAQVLAARYGEEPRVTYLRQSNRGVAAARNAGLDRARGSVIAFIDSDDVWQPWHLALAVAVLERFPDVGLVWTDVEAVDDTGAAAGSYLSTMLSAYGRIERETILP